MVSPDCVARMALSQLMQTACYRNRFRTGNWNKDGIFLFPTRKFLKCSIVLPHVCYLWCRSIVGYAAI